MRTKNPREIYKQYYRVMIKECERVKIDTEDELRKAIEMTRNMRSQLTGMQMMLEACGIMSREESAEEREYTSHDFDTSRLYGAIMTRTGELFRC